MGGKPVTATAYRGLVEPTNDLSAPPDQRVLPVEEPLLVKMGESSHRGWTPPTAERAGA